ncbi:MAG TPA: MBL fold metallo-hydrolase [Anaerolineae bacterium]|nr:MBL fold metallo-hydrolase [Anaerolineae bacterium]MCB0177788.1 MBL fold metallo-hydrolase [Anaerolineae bacterium]MCB0224533.1 MBL fold metallo-hydrolase [Anaerolineae bacterium]MCB9106683.1 MBL fold metallo-hydrolase [Anaerolineales bacterium]HRV95482.1 MBL fold metallo-hydrolase [Anaerolineae bacterium]
MLQEIAKNVFVEQEYEGANVGCVLTEAGAVVIDTPMVPEEARHWAKTVSELTDRVLYVFNTDHHRSHILGNQFFNAPIMAHEAAWKEMANYKDTFIERTKNLFKKRTDVQKQLDQIRIVKPELAFTGRLIMYKGGREIHFVHFGGHTPATSGVFLPDEHILFTGDLVVVNEHPALGQCNSDEWLAQLRWLRRQDFAVVVPGHGPLCNVDDSEPVSEYIRALRSKVRSQYKSGRTKAEAAVVISQMIDFFAYRPGEKSLIEKRIRAGVSRVYDEMKAIYGNG